MNEKEFIPKYKQYFYVLVEEKDGYFYKSHTEKEVFTCPILTDANFFINKELADKYKKNHKLKNFTIIKVKPKYYYE